MIPGIVGGYCSNFLKVKPGIVHYPVHVKPGILTTVKPGIVAYRKVLWCKENPRTRAICLKYVLNTKQQTSNTDSQRADDYGRFVVVFFVFHERIKLKNH